mgnify:CR=1 FL=1
MAQQGILSLAIKDRQSLYKSYMPFVTGGGLFVPSTKRFGLDGGEPGFIGTPCGVEPFRCTGDIGAHVDIGLNGKPGTAMAGFGAMLSDQEMAAIITYQRNAFGNNMGDMVQPIDVFNHKKG